jgi:multidrug efflux pump subunit AcrB
MKTKLGISGGLAARFQDNALTPLLAVAAMLLGVFAVIVTPREEEPQIDVTFANVFVGFPGASTTEVENLVALPMEQVLAEIDGVKHVYSVSRPGMGVLTVQFKVGEPRTEALVRLYNAIFSNQDWRPQNLGILPPIVKPKGIDDVPIVSATLWTEDTGRATQELKKVAHALEAEIKRVPGTRDVYTIGGSQEIVHVELDPQRVAGWARSFTTIRRSRYRPVPSLATVKTLRGWWSACSKDGRSTSMMLRRCAPTRTSPTRTRGLRQGLRLARSASIPSRMRPR